METRCEIDSLGEKMLPKSVYYGIQTLRAVENFPISGIQHPIVFIKSYVQVKKAAVQANMQVGWLDQRIGNAIVQACDEILANKFLDQFVVDVFQAGAGTSFNMNVNEVLANRTLELLCKGKGDYKSVSPNDHVNMSQSTNDTFPTALNVAILTAIQPLFHELDNLSSTFEMLSKKYGGVIKSGRTHLQDALPVTVGQEFGAYASALKNALNQLSARQQDLYQVALGATATGTGANTHPHYKQLAIAKLRIITNLPLTAAKDSFEALQSCRRLAAMSSGLRELALELIRIANDLRLLSSGPTTGLAEIQLPAVQPGSSIMPGKVNPVIAECLDMVAFQVLGSDLTVSFAAQAGQLELNVMTPVIMYNMLFSIQILTNCLIVFREKCVKGIWVDEKRCRSYVDKNPALATFLSPKIGYLEASMIAKQAVEENKSVKEVAVQKNVLSREELERIFDKKNLIGKTSEE